VKRPRLPAAATAYAPRAAVNLTRPSPSVLRFPDALSRRVEIDYREEATMSVHVTGGQVSAAEKLVRRVKSAGAGARLDVEAFWARNDKAVQDPFSPSCSHLPLGIVLSDECVFDELGVPADWHRLFHDETFHAELCRRFNDRAEGIIGRRPVPEHLDGDRDPERLPIKTLGDIFEARNEWRDESWSYWLHQSASTPDELAALLDRVERRLENLREFLFSPDWVKLKAGHLGAGKRIPLYRHQRGPVTFAMSIFGVENMIFLIMDNPDLAVRFRDIILSAILTRTRLIDEEAGYAAGKAPHGWSWADDNCAMLTPDMYRLFGYPVVKGMFDAYAPNPGDSRYQHSDSAMGHLLPILGTLGFTAVNFGPNLTVSQIRDHLPGAVIQGQLAPLTFSRDEEVNIVAETIRDFELSREHRGVLFATAGSVNAGSRLSGMRLVMTAIQELCRY
jgi:uroporphyrinogen decarboxylase